MKRIWSYVFFVICLYSPLFGHDNAVVRDKLIAHSKTFLGVPYRYGGASRTGMDCSGFVCVVFQEVAGKQLPRQSGQIFNYVTKIHDSSKQPGDLLFFSVYGNGRVGHLGIYLGGNEFIHSASSGSKTGVIISKLSEKYWNENYLGAGRVLEAATSAIASAEGSSPKQVEEKPVISSASSSAGGIPNRQPARGSLGVFHSIVGKFNIDLAATYDWSFYTPPSRFGFISRGLSVDAGLRFDGLLVNPGVGVSLFYDNVMDSYQIPFVLTLQPFEFMQVYGGVMLTAGNPKTVAQEGSEREAMGQLWPGVFGVRFILPAIEIGKVNMNVVQDIRYKSFSYGDGSAFMMTDALGSGVVFSTGIRVTFPLSNFL